MTIAQHAARTFERQESKGWFARLRDSWRAAKDLEVDDWTEPLKEPAPTRPEPQPTHTIPQQRPAVHPPFASTPAQMSHVLDRMIHRLVELRADPTMTAIKSVEALRPLNTELSGYAQHEFDQQRRMERNQQDAQAQAALLADAVRRGKDAEAVAQATEGIAGRAVHVADPEQTGIATFQPITDDMPDPRTVTVPADVNEGDVELAASPVHADSAPPIPEPTAAFLVGEGLVPATLPKRPRPRTDPEAHLATETAVLPVQGVSQTAVMPAFVGAGIADPGEGSSDDD